MTFNKYTSLLVSIFFLLCLSVFANHHLYTSMSSTQQDSLRYFPNNQSLSIYSNGYERVTADLLWMFTLSYFGTHLSSDHNYRYLANMLNTISQLNPNHKASYYMAGSILPWMGGSKKESNKLLIRAMVQQPTEGIWPYYLGLNLHLFQNDTATAAHYLQRAIQRDFSPRIAANLASRLKSEVSGLKGAQDWIKQMLIRNQDVNMKGFLKSQLKSIETEIILRKLDDIVTRLHIKEINITTLVILKRYVHHWPSILPDGGNVIMNNNGSLLSSKTSVRFKLHQSGKAKRMHEKLQ